MSLGVPKLSIYMSWIASDLAMGPDFLSDAEGRFGFEADDIRLEIYSARLLVKL